MTFAGVSRGLVASIFWTALASAQTLPTAAKIEAVPLELTMPERYQLNEVLEPIRKVTLVAPRDGLDPLDRGPPGVRRSRVRRARRARPHGGRRPAQDRHRRASRETGPPEVQQE